VIRQIPPTALMATAEPQQSLYVNNLNEKVKKEELKKSLYHVFSQYGNIVDIFASKTLKMRGQAWIVFDDMTAATKALREMQNFNFYGKPMRVTYSKSKSDVIAKADGSFKPRPLRKPELAGKAEKKKAELKKEEGGATKKRKTKESKKKKDKAEKDSSANKDEDVSMSASASASSASAVPSSASEPPAPPNNILFVENLPVQCTTMMLAMLFQQYSGYKESRLVAGKPGIAFVEFADEDLATIALEGLQTFKITPQNLMKISYAKR